MTLDPLVWIIALPLLLGILSFLAGPRSARLLSLPGLALLLLAAAATAHGVFRAGPIHHRVGGWGAPLGIDLYADGLAAAMLLLNAVVAAGVGAYANPYFRIGTFTRRRAGEASEHAAPGAAFFWPLTWFLLGAMNALYLSADIFNLYVTLELLGLAAVGLVAVAGGAPAVSAALRYLLAALLGSLAYLMGVALLYGEYGTVSIPLLTESVTAGPGPWLAAALMLFGLLIKTALFPLHFWLPPAHGGAVTPVSALLSGLVIKASFYLALRLWTGVFEPLVTPAAGQLLGWLGAGAILWGSVMALLQSRLKMLVAYSTVAQVGYLFLLFPLTVGVPEAAAASAWSGGVYQALSHGLAKAAMFLAAGAIVLAMGRDEIAGMEGIGKRHPLGLFAFALAAMSLMGLPPSGGFVAKWLLLKGALYAGQWWWIVVMILGGLLTAAYVVRVLRQAFLTAPPERHFRALPARLETAAFVLALASLGLGLNAVWPLRLLEIGSPFPGFVP